MILYSSKLQVCQLNHGTQSLVEYFKKRVCSLRSTKQCSSANGDCWNVCDLSIQRLSQCVKHLKEKLKVVKLVALAFSRQKFSSDPKLSLLRSSNKTTHEECKTFKSYVIH
jgi:hypothetical protein